MVEGFMVRMASHASSSLRRSSARGVIRYCVCRPSFSSSVAMGKDANPQHHRAKFVVSKTSQPAGDIGKVRQERAQVQKYNARISCCEGSLQAESILTEMLSQGIHPTIITYNTLLSKFSEDGRMEDVDTLVHRMKTSGIQLDVYSYTTLIEGHTRAGSMARAEAAYEDFLRQGLSVDLVLSNSVLTMYCKQAKLEQAERVFASMTTPGNVPDAASFSILISGHARVGNIARSLDLFKKLTRIRSIMPDATVLNAVVLLLALNNRCACCFYTSHKFSCHD
jgi:pentatricopeptide repeat protein